MVPAKPTIIKLRRGRKKKRPIQPKELTGRKYLEIIGNHLTYLRALYPHHNRVLFYDDVVVCYLLAFFNTVVRSLRCIEDASQIPGINQFLSVETVCKSTLSEANALFDPQHLEGLIQRLRRDLPNLHQIDGELATLLDHVKAVDGSYFRVAADTAWALHQAKPDGKLMAQIRLNCQFCLRTGTPGGVSISGDDGVGEGAAATLFVDPEEHEAIYLFDSGVVKFSYLRTILKAQSHFLCNLREHIQFESAQEKPLSDADRAAGVVSDRVGYLTSSHAPRGEDAAPKVMLREVRIDYVDRQGKHKQLRLLTDLLALPAHLIAELYRHRWQVELFFRWLKVHANFRHLTSHSKNGVTLGFYVAVIAMMLTCLHTQAPLSKYGYNMMAMVAAGLGDIDDVLPILHHRERERQREKERQARKRAEKRAENKKA
jgi:hypothetical protein